MARDSYSEAENLDGTIDEIILLDGRLFYGVEKALDYLVDVCGFSLFDAANYLTLLRRDYERAVSERKHARRAA